jgi:hypothetical protein
MSNIKAIRSKIAGFSRSRKLVAISISSLVALAGVYTILFSHADTPSGQVALNSASFNTRVTIGHGFVEASARQIVRTSNDVVYVITSDDNSSPAVIRVWKGSPAGIPTSFSEVDAAHHPSADKIGSPDTRLDDNNVIQIAYNDESNHDLYYQTFNTNTDTWGSRSMLATNAETGLDNGSQGDRTGNVAIILDANDNPNIAYTTTANTVVYVPSNGSSGGFAAGQTVSTGTLPIHPALAMDSTNAVDLTWVDNSCNLNGGCNGTTSPSSIVKYAQRTPAGVWQTPEVVASGSGAVNNNIYLDQSPNIIADSNNVPYVIYIDGTNDHMHIAHRTGTNTWVDDSPAPASYAGYVHDPTIYSQGTDIYAIPGHNGNINYGFQYQLGGAGNTWSPFVLLDSTENDGSASVRWDPFRETDSRVIDTIYFNENSPTTLYYMAIQPRGSSDTTPPTVSLTAPSGGATVSGTTSITANASDNVGVTSVQFKLDGSNLGSADTTSPYSFSWDTTGASNGSHTLTAVASDAAGNTTTSSSVSVTVSNSTPDTTPPTTSISSGPASSTTSTSASFSFTGTDNVTPSGSLTFQCSLDSASYTSCTSPQNYTSLSVGSHTFNVRAIDAANNTDPSPASQTWTITSSAPVTGDLDGDGHVTGHDLSILLSHYGTNYATAELDGGTIVEGHDLSILLSHYGT